MLPLALQVRFLLYIGRQAYSLQFQDADLLNHIITSDGSLCH